MSKGIEAALSRISSSRRIVHVSVALVNNAGQPLTRGKPNSTIPLSTRL
jgi:hypothetical protein